MNINSLVLRFTNLNVWASYYQVVGPTRNLRHGGKFCIHGSGAYDRLDLRDPHFKIVDIKLSK